MFASELRGFDHSPVYLHMAPLSHGSGAKILPTIASGGCNVVVPRFDPELMAETIRAERVTHTFLVPTIIQRLLEAGPDVRDCGAGRCARSRSADRRSRRSCFARRWNRSGRS